MEISINSYQILAVLVMLTIRKIYITSIKLYQYLKNISIDFFVNSKILILTKLILKKTEIYYYIKIIKKVSVKKDNIIILFALLKKS